MSRWSTAPRPAPTPAAQTALPWPPGARRGPARALLISLLLHALLLSLSFGGAGVGLPGLALPWQTRRAEVPNLRIVLAAPRPVPAMAPAPPPALPITRPTTPAGSAEPSAPPARGAPADEAPPHDVPPPAPQFLAAPAVPAAPAVIAVDKPGATTWAVPTALPASAPVIAALAAASSPALTPLRQASDTPRLHLDREATERAAELAQLDRAHRDTEQQARQQTERFAAAQAEAERAEAA
ncbi:MAG: hypothetical protein ACT6RP_21410, partial [Roseateles sp.]